VKRVAALATLALAPFGARPLPAQTAGLGDQNSVPAWLEVWSPLGSRADLPRLLPHVDAVPASLLLPAPRVGLFWTAGNPAALRDELADTRTDFGFGLRHESGTLRRPLDPAASSLRQAEGTGWTPVDSTLALLGRVVVDQDRFDPGARADMVEPYPTSPFVTLDTSTTPTRRIRAALEGALSVRLGGWSLGAALGYEGRDHETIAAGFIRRSRQTLPGATIGLTRRIGSVRLGPYARWRNRAETIYLIVREASGLVVELQGLRDVTPFTPIGYYYRRVEEDMPTAGWSVAGPLAGGAWAAYAERSWLRERLTRQEADNPTEDTWTADAWAGGGAYQRPLGRQVLFTLDGRYTTLRGDGDLALDTLGVIFQAAERALTVSAEVRVLPDTTGWAVAVGAQVRLEHRLRNALTVPVAAEVTGLTEGVTLELGRAFSPRLFATATIGSAYYSANSSIPNPAAMGPSYTAYVSPDYDLASRPAQAWLGALGVRWTASPRTSLWIRATAQTVSPTKAGITFGPEGSRTALGATGGVTLRAR
jgi:hypothetical protein